MHTESEHGVDAASVVAAATAEAETIAASPLQVGDRVTARLLFGTFDGLTVVEVLPVARRARVTGWMGRFTGSGDERQDSIEVAFEDINPEAES
ncbi:hypothetical protein [uncultured Maricaulis sp.]|uniref:hypothetical protein n=1 Tax=uncultured Maricaulis sp. TaxID=174710 RepID=UPI0030DC2842